MAAKGNRSVAFWLFLGEKSKLKLLFYNGGGEATHKSGNGIQISQSSVLDQLKEACLLSFAVYTAVENRYLRC